MQRKNLYTLLVVILGVILIFFTGLYSGLMLNVFKPQNNFSSWLVSSAKKNNPPAKGPDTAVNKGGVLSFLPLSGKQQLGQGFNVKVIMDTQGQLSFGADVVANYDPAILELLPYDEIADNKNPLGTRIVKDWGNGKIVFSYLAPAQTTWQNEIELATLSFTPKQTGRADLKFVFDEKIVLDCTIAGEGGKDILERVYNAHFEVK